MNSEVLSKLLEISAGRPCFIGSISATKYSLKGLDQYAFDICKLNQSDDPTYLITEEQLGILNSWAKNSGMDGPRTFAFSEVSVESLENHRREVGDDLTDRLLAKFFPGRK